MPNWAYDYFLPWCPSTDRLAELVDVLFECVGDNWFFDSPIAFFVIVF